MDQIELNSSPRTVVGKQVRALRRQGLIPIVLYSSHMTPMHLQADQKELARVLRQAGGSRLITVKTDGTSQQALARDVQREPITGQLLHVDLLAVSMTERIRVEVPLVLDGKPGAVKRNEGVLLTGLDTVEIECLPAELIDSIHVNLDALDQVGDSIQVSDLQVPDTIKILTDPGEMVARVTYLAAEEVEPVAPAAEIAEPEVIAKGKVEEEEEEGEKE